MSDPFITGAQGAVSTLKNAQQVGKQLGGVVSDQQAEMERAVQEASRQRKLAAARKAYEESLEEFKAFEAYEKQKAHEKEVARIKAQAISKYGANAWTEIEALKIKLKKEKEKEDDLMDADRHKVQELFWWCMTVAALITYFFKLYK
jgi:hypothetical protein